MSDFVEIANSIIRDLEYSIRADERERLANEFLERGDIGTGLGEMRVDAWLMRQDGSANPRRRVTKKDYEPKTSDRSDTVVFCVQDMMSSSGKTFICGMTEDDDIHQSELPRVCFQHEFRAPSE
jgi:hypothetical protein